jgi:hypothetical protein
MIAYARRTMTFSIKTLLAKPSGDKSNHTGTIARQSTKGGMLIRAVVPAMPKWRSNRNRIKLSPSAINDSDTKNKNDRGA